LSARGRPAGAVVGALARLGRPHATDNSNKQRQAAALRHQQQQEEQQHRAASDGRQWWYYRYQQLCRSRSGSSTVKLQ
jgi:ribosomal protein S14